MIDFDFSGRTDRPRVTVAEVSGVKDRVWFAFLSDPTTVGAFGEYMVDVLTDFALTNDVLFTGEDLKVEVFQ